MPISPIVLQRRHAELGRIRLGDKATTQNGGTRPQKLSKFRFTSPSKAYVEDLATLYGGEPRKWDNNGKPEWEVYSDTQMIPVIVVKGGLSQWLETWSGGGCIHRCDGVINVLTGDPCDLSEQVTMGRKNINPHAEAKPTTRVSMMLPELAAIGVFRMETHGWNAAAEIPAVAELAQFVGDLVPANLHLVERRSVKDGQTSRFVVPVLDLQIGQAKLREIVAERLGETPAIESGTPSVAAIEAPKSIGVDWLAKLDATGSIDDCRVLWAEAVDARFIGPEATPSTAATDFVDAWKTRAKEFTPEPIEEAPRAPEPAVDEDGVVDAELVPDADAEAVWQRVLTVTGLRGWGLEQTNGDFFVRMGLPAGEASEQELLAYLDALNAEVAA